MDNDSPDGCPRWLRQTRTSPAVSATAHASGSEGGVADRLQELLLNSLDMDEFLQGLAGELASLAAAAGGLNEVECAITLHRPRRADMHAGTTDRAKMLGTLPGGPGEGLGSAARQVGRSVLVSNTAEDLRWPIWAAQSLGAGIGSVLTTALDLEAEACAVIAYLSPVTDGFNTKGLRGAELDATSTRPALLLALRISAARQEAEDLKQAMTSRTVINLAVGVIMGQQRCSQDEAFAILARAASNRNRKLRVVAQELVMQVTGKGVSTHFGQ